MEYPASQALRTSNNHRSLPKILWLFPINVRIHRHLRRGHFIWPRKVQPSKKRKTDQKNRPNQSKRNRKSTRNLKRRKRNKEKPSNPRATPIPQGNPTKMWTNVFKKRVQRSPSPTRSVLPIHQFHRILLFPSKAKKKKTLITHNKSGFDWSPQLNLLTSTTMWSNTPTETSKSSTPAPSSMPTPLNS